VNIVKGVLIAVLIGCITISAFNAYLIEKEYSAERAMHENEMRFRPEPSYDIAAHNAAEFHEDFVNQSILDLQALYPDVVGWITLPYTDIDYPFVQAANNSAYLSRDLDGNHSIAGSIFMEHENDRDFFDFNTIIYGHNMKNGSMFGTLKEFNNKSFFNANKNGTIFLSDKTYAVDFFAFLVVPVGDDIIFSIPADRSPILLYIDHVKEKARHYRETGITPEDRIVMLSTCAYEFDDARMALLGKITRIE